MSLPRLDYQRPDYAGGIGEALGGAAKTVNDWSPASAPIQKYLRAHLDEGMDPREAAIMAKLEMGGHIGGGNNSAPQGQQLTGGNTTFQGPSSQAPMGRVNSPAQMPMPASQPQVGGGFTGKREFTGPEETITASRQMGSQPPDLSALDRAPQDNTPILNRDVPQLMSAAGQAQKHDPADTYMKLYALGLRGDALNEKVREFEGMQPVRQSMINQRDAGINNMPLKNQQAEGRLDVSKFNAQTSRGGLDTRRAENYLKGAGPSLEVTAGLGDLIQQGLKNPEIVGTNSDYVQRRVAQVAGNLPLLGKFIESGLTTGADEDLSFAQREFKRRLTGELSTFIHSRYGSALSAHELALANQIAGGQLSIADTLAGAQAIYYIAQRKGQLYQRAYPDAAQQVGTPTTGPRIPTNGPYPTGFEGGLENLNQPGPAGPSLQDELQQAPQAPRLRGTTTNEGIR